MKDYLNRDEQNQIISMMALAQQIEGVRTMVGRTGKPIWEDWRNRDFLTKEEGKNIKTAHTFMLKFVNAVLGRIDKKEHSKIMKKLEKFDFRIVDEYTWQKINRDATDKLKNAVVPRKQFNDWCEQIMACNCKECKINWNECNLHEVFEENFIPESGFDHDNCKFSYCEIRKEDAV
ncbi:MAG: DUF5651 domain-containing protein [Clostridiaceae bacterium]